MSYGKRIDMLCSLLAPAKIFADVGCDHGYCVEYMLKNSLCERAIASDISAGSLAKAETLLRDYIRAGRASAILGDGFSALNKAADEVLIAGMGGCEMISVLSDCKNGYIPERFVLQPMRDAEKLRRWLLENGAFLSRDFTFSDRKFYDVLCGGRATPNAHTTPYTDEEYEFGRENLQTFPDAFLRRTQLLLKNTEKYLASGEPNERARAELEGKRARLKKALDAATDHGKSEQDKSAIEK